MSKKTFVLDVAKWRCGGYSHSASNYLGAGQSSLLNEEGLMCCLGQFATQCGYSPDELHDRLMPDNIRNGVKFDYRPFLRCDGKNTKLSIILSDINDDVFTTVKQKIKLLRKELKEKGIRLIVKNQGLI